MKKILLLFTLLITISINAQVGIMNFFVLNEGSEADYLKLETIWSEYQQYTVDNGEKMGWSVWKVDMYDGKPMENTAYIVFNVFESQEQAEAVKWNQKKFLSVVKKRLKGKMSSSYINKILAKNVKKDNYQSTFEVVDMTPLVGGDLKPGDKMYFNSMTQKNDDYEKFESEVWKPIVMQQLMAGNQRQWVLTKTLTKNELLQEVNPDGTHTTWNFMSADSAPSDQDAQEMLNQMDFKTSKLFGLLSESVEMKPRWDATMIMGTY